MLCVIKCRRRVRKVCSKKKSRQTFKVAIRREQVLKSVGIMLA